MKIRLNRPLLRSLAGIAAWGLFLTSLAFAAFPAEAGAPAGKAKGPGHSDAFPSEAFRWARAEIAVPERTAVPRMAADLDDSSQTAPPVDEGSSTLSPNAEVPTRSASPASPLDEAKSSEDGEISGDGAADSTESGDMPGAAAPDPMEAFDDEADETGFESFSPEQALPEASEAYPETEEPANAEAPVDGIAPLVEYGEGRVTIRATGEPLGDVLHEIREAGDIQIQGLNHRADDPLSFQVENVPVEGALKRLMRHLKENNYAFEYSRTRLRRISVFPAGRTEAVSRAPAAPVPQAGEEEEARERVVRVINVQEGTQAENLDLQQGDLIVEYDGEAINSAQQLVDAVKARSAEQIVQMTVVREGNRFPLTLNGGLIGINILTVNVPQDALGR
ncbi:MAG: PDZ domain-containing protein [Desulfococcaceae bacterium]